MCRVGQVQGSCLHKYWDDKSKSFNGIMRSVDDILHWTRSVDSGQVDTVIAGGCTSLAPPPSVEVCISCTVRCIVSCTWQILLQILYCKYVQIMYILQFCSTGCQNIGKLWQLQFRIEIGLDGFSTLKNPCFDPWHMPVAQFYQKLYFQGVTRGTRVYGHVAHLGMV